MSNEKTYTDREIDTLHNALMSKLDTIEAQVRKTNGRVTLLEKFMWVASGAIAVLSLKELSNFLGGLF